MLNVLEFCFFRAPIIFSDKVGENNNGATKIQNTSDAIDFCIISILLLSLLPVYLILFPFSFISFHACKRERRVTKNCVRFAIKM